MRGGDVHMFLQYINCNSECSVYTHIYLFTTAGKYCLKALLEKTKNKQSLMLNSILEKKKKKKTPTHTHLSKDPRRLHLI